MAEGDVTQILLRIGEGESRAADVLLPIVYDQLHALAASYLRHERPGHTLQTTALVHEAYIKLVDQTQAQYLNRAHFYAIAAQAMRRILVNYARDAKRLKRGGGHHRLDLADPPASIDHSTVDLDSLDLSLQRLAALDDRKARTVEMRFFGGMSIEDTAAALGIAPATVKRDWDFARAWLARDMSTGESQ